MTEHGDKKSVRIPRVDNNRTYLLPVAEAQISQAVSRNPVFSFRLKGGAQGDKIEVSWLDNHGESAAIEAAVA